MPPVKKTETKAKSKKLDSKEHHCSQCNRPKLHEVFEHKDGVTMKCPCGYEFVDVRPPNITVDTVDTAETIELGTE